MRKIFFNILVILVSLNPVRSQNLVPNPSFEFISSTGAGYSIADTSFQDLCWADPLMNGEAAIITSLAANLSSGPTYINHTARTGLNKASIELGFCSTTNLPDSNANDRSYLQTRLIHPLIAGQTYTFKMYVSGPPLQSDDTIFSWCYIATTTARNLGVSISATRPFNPSTSTSIPYGVGLYAAPQLNFNGISFVTDMYTWIELTGTYVATGGEQYLTIGNFDPYPATVFESTAGPLVCSYTIFLNALLFVDDISLVPVGITDTTATYLNIGNDTAICSTTPVNLTLTAQTGFYTYLWNTGETSNSIHVTTAGTYYCSVGTSCSQYTDSITITSVLNNPTGFTLGNDTSLCDNAPFSIPLHVPAIFDSYLWSTGDTTSSINVTATGTYWVKAMYPCGEASDTIVIHSTPFAYSLTLGNDTIICNNEAFSIPLTATGGFSHYTWSTGATTASITVNNPGTYWVQADSTCGAVADTVQIHSQLYLALNLGNDTTKCFDGVPFTLTANPGFTSYVWNTGAHTQQITAVTTGSYYVTASYYCGTLSDTILATINPVPASPVTADTTVCLLSNAVLLHAAGQNILWYGSATSPAGSATAPVTNSTDTGDFLFYATQTVNGCTSAKSVMDVKVLAPPVFELGSPQIICAEQRVTLGPDNSSWNYLWNDGITYSPRIVSGANDLALTATNSCGSFMDSVQIALDDCDCHVYLPNAFTPNSDGLNDVFKPTVDCDMQSYELRIFDRWGELVFQANNPGQGWNGQYKGNLCEQDVYVVQITYQGMYSNKKVLMDKVVLVR